MEIVTDIDRIRNRAKLRELCITQQDRLDELELLVPLLERQVRDLTRELAAARAAVHRSEVFCWYSQHAK